MLMASGVLRAVLEAHFVGEKAVKEECKKKKKKRRMQLLTLSLQLSNSA